MHIDLIPRLQRHVALIAANGSSLRNQGAAGVVDGARKHLASLAVLRLPRFDIHEFTRHLGEETDAMVRGFPEGGQSWGAARKVLNPFLRDCLYNVSLRDAFGLGAVEYFFEVPLDSHVAAGLIDSDHGDDLPPWPGVKRVDRATNALYQDIAMLVADDRDTDRVHLDLWFWRSRG